MYHASFMTQRRQTQKWRQPQNEDDLQNKINLENKDDLKNEYYLKNEDYLKNGGDLKNEDNTKMSMASKSLPEKIVDDMSPWQVQWNRKCYQLSKSEI